MGAFARFTTDGLVQRDRIDGWAHHWEALVGLEARALDDADFHGSVQSRHLVPLSFGRIKVGAHAVERTRRLISKVDHDLLKVVFQLSGETCVAQGDQRAIMRPGEWMIYDMSRPYRLYNIMPTEQLALMVPRSAFGGLASGARLLAMQPMQLSGVAKLLQRCAIGVLEDLPEAETSVDRDVGASVLDLLRLSLNDRQGLRDRTSMQETMRERVRSYIRRNLHDPELNLDGIAQAMHCTKRYLHKLFSDGQTISEFIWSMRLTRCGEELAAPRNADRSITEIAFANGFSNSAHFSRVFKARYGVPPRTFRACPDMALWLPSQAN